MLAVIAAIGLQLVEGTAIHGSYGSLLPPTSAFDSLIIFQWVSVEKHGNTVLDGHQGYQK